MSKLRTLFEQYEAVVLFDTETTGLDAKSDRIIELAAIRIEQTPSGGLRLAGKMDNFVRLPEGQRIPEKVVELTGITDEILEREGVRPEKAADSFAKLLAGRRILVGAHNAQFDLLFARELLRGKKIARLDFLDTVTVYKDRRPYPHKLANAILAYDLEDKVKNSHRAIDDVLALLEVVKAMAEAGGECFEGQMAVAQCILNACEKTGSQPSEVVLAYQYAKPAKVATQSVKDAVAAVFDTGDTVTTEPILFFYAPRRTVSQWHESQRFVIEIGGHRFFAEKGANP